MLYLSGIHALNLPCSLLTCGDWHTSGINWHSFVLLESNESIFGDYGIEQGKTIPDNPGTFNVANHIRALLDLLAQGKFSVAQGMNKDFICNDSYTEEIFQKVSLMKSLDNWAEIDRFMGREYYSEWLKFKDDYLVGKKEISKPEIARFESASASTVEKLIMMKAIAYAAGDKLADLRELSFVCNRNWDKLPEILKTLVRNVIQHKGIEQFDFLIKEQQDDLIDADELISDFLEMYEKLGLLCSENEQRIIREVLQKENKSTPL